MLYLNAKKVGLVLAMVLFGLLTSISYAQSSIVDQINDEIREYNDNDGKAAWGGLFLVEANDTLASYQEIDDEVSRIRDVMVSAFLNKRSNQYSEWIKAMNAILEIDLLNKKRRWPDDSWTVPGELVKFNDLINSWNKKFSRYGGKLLSVRAGYEEMRDDLLLARKIYALSTIGHQHDDHKIGHSNPDRGGRYPYDKWRGFDDAKFGFNAWFEGMNLLLEMEKLNEDRHP